MAVDVAVAGRAGGVAHRLEGPDVARVAIVAEAGMGGAEMAGGPDLVGLEMGEALGALLAVVEGLDRPADAQSEDEQGKQPGRGALARHHRGEGEEALGAALELRLPF